MRDLLTYGAMVIGLALLVLAQVSGIGYGLYSWAHHMTLPQAAWAGFILWIQMIVVGFPLLVVGSIFKDGVVRGP